MENIEKLLSSTKKPTLESVLEQAKAVAFDTVNADTSEAGLGLLINKHLGTQKSDPEKWYNFTDLDKATEGPKKTVRRIQKAYYDALHVRAKEKAKALGKSDAEVKKAKYSNPSTPWSRILRHAKADIEGFSRLGERKEYSYTDKVIKGLWPVWNQIATATTTTHDEIALQKKVATFLQEVSGRSPQHIKVNELGTTVTKKK